MNTDTFQLHPRLEADTACVGDLELSRVLLMNDAAWPWLILVPRQPGLREWIDLPRPQRHRLDDEIAQVSQVLLALHQPYKLNVAALGNVVEQLHVHIIARHTTDPAWPAPVWGRQAPTPYGPQQLEQYLHSLRRALQLA